MKNEAVIEAYLGRGLKNKPRPRAEAAAVTFLVGEAMTGGYGGADILHGCTIAVDRARSPSSSARTAPASRPR